MYDNGRGNDEPSEVIERRMQILQKLDADGQNQVKPAYSEGELKKRYESYGGTMRAATRILRDGSLQTMFAMLFEQCKSLERVECTVANELRAGTVMEHRTYKYGLLTPFGCPDTPADGVEIIRQLIAGAAAALYSPNRSF